MHWLPAQQQPFTGKPPEHSPLWRVKADNVVLENGGRLDVLSGHTATNTRVDDGGTLDVRNGGTATTVSMGNGGYCWPIPGRCQWYRSDGTAFSIGGGQADALMLEKAVHSR